MSKTLLLADDSVTIQRVIELTFAHEDIRVIAFSDGRRALQYLDTEHPDIVLVDVGVPEVDGYAVAAKIKGSPRLRQVPVVLLASAGAKVDEVKARNIGCEGVLVKPFEPQQLVSRVKELLAKSSPSGGGGSFQAAPIDPFGDPGGEPQPLEPPARPVWEQASTAPAETTRPSWEQQGQTPRQADPAPAGKVSLANAFSALLAAEQSKQPSAGGPTTPALTEAGVEELVRRVIARMSAEEVRRIVIETTERLVKEEIEKIKASPE
jgi:DNA-binding response OmpR family regulator